MMKRGSIWIAGVCLIVLAAGGFAAHHEGASEAVENDGKPVSEPEKETASENTTQGSGSAGSSTQNPCMEDIENIVPILLAREIAAPLCSASKTTTRTFPSDARKRFKRACRIDNRTESLSTE